MGIIVKAAANYHAKFGTYAPALSDLATYEEGWCKAYSTEPVFTGTYMGITSITKRRCLALACGTRSLLLPFLSPQKTEVPVSFAPTRQVQSEWQTKAHFAQPKAMNSAK